MLDPTDNGYGFHQFHVNNSQGTIQVPIQDFLGSHNFNYLIIHNPFPDPVEYEIYSDDNFTLPEMEIIGISQFRNFKQNIRWYRDKTEILEFLKYSLVQILR